MKADLSFRRSLACVIALVACCAAEAALPQLASPTRSLPFAEVIESTTGWRVLRFDTNVPAHGQLRQMLLKAAALAGERAASSGLGADRANEAGNAMEPFVRAALREAGLPAQVPITTSGRAQTTGYPDISIPGDPPCYLELKSYNRATAATSQRTFYFSPSEHPKVTTNALHLLLAYELMRTNREGRAVFVPVRWKLLSLEDLLVNLKYEFNQGNRELYGPRQPVLGSEPVTPTGGSSRPQK